MHLIVTLEKQCVISVEWLGSKYSGLTLDWEYAQRLVTLPTPNYVFMALRRFYRNTPAKPVCSSDKFELPACGAKVQHATQESSGTAIYEYAIQFMHQVAGVFLCHARALHNTMLVTSNDISRQQASAITSIMDTIDHFLDHVATHPISKLRCYRSNMILHVRSASSYFSVSKSHSRVGGCFFLSRNDDKPQNAPRNGEIHVPFHHSQKCHGISDRN